MMSYSNYCKKIALAIMAIIPAMPLLLIASNNNFIGDDVKKNHKFSRPITLKDTIENERSIIGIDIRNHAEIDGYHENRESATKSVSSSEPQYVESITVNGVTFKMIHVDGGTFTMGATNEQEEDAYSSEKPTHVVNISGFLIGETEVTQELWQAVMDYNPSRYTGDMNRPVETVSWYDCQAFIFKLNQLTGKHFRLPTEAEWEYASRGGNKSNGYKYAGSNDLNNVGWYANNSDYMSHPVGLMEPNELGLFDMSGNVMEWCQDGYTDYFNYATDTLTNPWGHTFVGVNRGGSFNDINRNCRVSSRFRQNTNAHNYECGFRLAISGLNGNNVSFLKEEQYTTTTQSTITIPVALSRGNTDGDYTARVTLGEPRPDNVSLQNQWITFADGERVSCAHVVFRDMAIGNTYNCILNLSKADEATVNPEYGPQIPMTSVIVNRDYNWINIGNGFYSSPEWWEDEFYVPIMHAEGTNIYRMIGLFEDGYNIQFTINADNTVTVPGQPSWIHNSYGEIWLVGDANHTANGYAGTYNPATKKVTFILYHYVPGVGGFGTYVDTLTMP